MYPKKKKMVNLEKPIFSESMGGGPAASALDLAQVAYEWVKGIPQLGIPPFGRPPQDHVEFRAWYVWLARLRDSPDPEISTQADIYARHFYTVAGEWDWHK